MAMDSGQRRWVILGAGVALGALALALAFSLPRAGGESGNTLAEEADAPDTPDQSLGDGDIGGTVDPFRSLAEVVPTSDSSGPTERLDVVPPEAVRHSGEKSLYGEPLPSVSQALKSVAYNPGGFTLDERDREELRSLIQSYRAQLAENREVVRRAGLEWARGRIALGLGESVPSGERYPGDGLAGEVGDFSFCQGGPDGRTGVTYSIYDVPEAAAALEIRAQLQAEARELIMNTIVGRGR